MDDIKQGTYKTINQLSKEYGLTKNGMAVRVKKMTADIKRQGLNESDYVTKGKQNTVYVMPKGLEWLANWNENNTPMQEPTRNLELELYKLEQAEQKITELEGRLLDMKQYSDFLQLEIGNKSNQIQELTKAISNQAQIIDDQNKKINELTLLQPLNAESAPDPEPESNQEPTHEQTATETDNARNAQNAPKTAFSISDEQITAELSKRGFMGKLKLLFGH